MVTSKFLRQTPPRACSPSTGVTTLTSPHSQPTKGNASTVPWSTRVFQVFQIFQNKNTRAANRISNSRMRKFKAVPRIDEACLEAARGSATTGRHRAQIGVVVLSTLQKEGYSNHWISIFGRVPRVFGMYSGAGKRVPQSHFGIPSLIGVLGTVDIHSRLAIWGEDLQMRQCT